jgi:hypothetical protein
MRGDINVTPYFDIGGVKRAHTPYSALSNDFDMSKAEVDGDAEIDMEN